MVKKFCITTAIDYVNDTIHIGHAYQKVMADVMARFHRCLGEEVFFLTGTDEHGAKALEAAEKVNLSPQEFVDNISTQDKEELRSFNISWDRFIRTTDEDHIKQVIDFYNKVKKNGDIYLGKFEGWYCRGCEEYKTASELKDGHCPHHPHQKIEKLSEENYFFRLSKYEDFLKNHFKNNPSFCRPEGRRREMMAFLDQGLKDISISRQAVSWGIPVPDDPKQTIYVWFDALINYLTGVPTAFWPVDLHLLGKDNTRFHAILWPAMLKSAGYSLPKTVYCHGFLTLNGQKISKSLGNIIRPSELITRFGADGARYVLLTATTLASDGDISWQKMIEKYNADLANGLGNLTARLVKLCQMADFNYQGKELPFRDVVGKDYYRDMKNYAINKVLNLIWVRIGRLDHFINEKEPWQIKNEKELVEILQFAVEKLLVIAVLLRPFLPETSDKVIQCFSNKKITGGESLFPRINNNV